jgi:predicted Zn-dependent protease with MMP-like domain
MARSKIIQDLANSKVDTMTALKRAKVLLSELGNSELLNWINYEITGYPSEVILPDYRIEHGNLIGSYFKGSIASHMKWTNVSLPLGKMPDDLKDVILSVQFREGVDALKQLSESSADGSGQLGKVIPADFFPAIATYNEDPYMMITSAKVLIGPQCIQNVFSVIENRLLDILILLEKEFGNLDELDLDLSSKTPEELQDITNKIIVIVYNDHSVNIGDGNKITRSDIASSIKNKLD